MNDLALVRLDEYLKANNIPVAGIRILGPLEEATDYGFTVIQNDTTYRFDISFTESVNTDEVQQLLDNFDCCSRRRKTHNKLTTEILQWLNQPQTTGEKLTRLARLTARMAASLMLSHGELLKDDNLPDIDDTEPDEN